MDLTGTTVASRYKILRSLGEGAMGSVFLAEDTELSRQVAIKVLRPEVASLIEVQRRLEKECRIQAQMGAHPNLVTLFDRLSADGQVALVMEYVNGEVLSSILERTAMLSAQGTSGRTAQVSSSSPVLALSRREAIEIALQCLDALEFAHSRGVLHRDVKPSNIMITRDHQGRLVAKLTDFGIAKALTGGDSGAFLTSMTATGMPGPGTPLYMAPEQIDPARFGAPGPAADLYSFGVTLFEMLSGEPPFQGSFTTLLNSHTNVPPPDPRKIRPDFPERLCAALDRALQKQPEDRFRSAEDFKSALREAMSIGANSGATQLRWSAGQEVQSGGKSGKHNSSGTKLMSVVFSVALGVMLFSVATYFWLKKEKKSQEVAVHVQELDPPPPTPIPHTPLPATPTPVDPEPEGPTMEEIKAKARFEEAEQFDSSKSQIANKIEMWQAYLREHGKTGYNVEIAQARLEFWRKATPTPSPTTLPTPTPIPPTPFPTASPTPTPPPTLYPSPETPISYQQVVQENPEEVVERYFQACDQGDYQGAYNCFSEFWRTKTGKYRSLQDYRSKIPNLGREEYRVNSQSRIYEKGNKVTLKVNHYLREVGSTGENVWVKVDLSFENGAWKIDTISDLK